MQTQNTAKFARGALMQNRMRVITALVTISLVIRKPEGALERFLFFHNLG